MDASKIDFGLRDLLSYVVPGSLALGVTVWHFPFLAARAGGVLLASMAVVVGSYIIGHICKGIGDRMLRPHMPSLSTRWWRFRSPYLRTIFSNAVWGRSIGHELRQKLKVRWGNSAVKESRSSPTLAGRLVLLCWYDVLGTKTEALKEIDRYIGLFNLCMSLTVSLTICAVVSVLGAIHNLEWRLLLLMFPFMLLALWCAILWQHYEESFARAILRAWFVSHNPSPISNEQRDKEKMDDDYT